LSDAANTLVDSDSRELDSEVLLAHVLNKPRSFFRAWPEKTLSENELNTFHQVIKLRQAGAPTAYITGNREFWSREFTVSPDVLIPRPDTELLIEITQQKFTREQSFRILDLGTGSGAIAITLALEFRNAVVTAIDSREKTLGIAQKNAQNLGATDVKFFVSDWFSQVAEPAFDLIISNPPYICSTDPHLCEGDVRFEPTTALISEHGGLHDIQHIISTSCKYLKPNGVLLFEHGYKQGKQVKNLLESSRFELIEQFNDIQGHLRATLGIKP
jgi:release factor glutamine methyltransferase